MRIGGLVPLSLSHTAAWDMTRAAIGRYSSGRRMTPQSPNEALQPEAPPPPPPKPPSRRRPTLSALSGFLSFLVIGAVGVLVAFVWATSRLNAPGPLAEDKVVYIAPHTDVPDIIEKLQSEGVIDNSLAFNLVLMAERKRGKVKYGEYLFKQHASLRAVVDTLVGGKQVTHSITIPEGLTSAQVVQRLRDSDLLVGEIREIPKEGSLLPETYKFSRGMSRVDLIDKMQQDDRRAVEQIWSRRAPDLPLRSPYELVTLASMVEKETGKADERPRVAGVFINRLIRHMRLQSDPTIVYGLVAGQGTLGHSITRGELDRKTPYNTYQIDGLPPGPIDNPGRAALEAVANPSRTADLYFVADGTGGHAFAATIEEHNRNVVRWRQIQQEAKDKPSDVDHLAPSVAAPPPRGNQRSDADEGSVFGTLPKAVGATSLGRVASFTDPEASHDIAKVAAAEALVPASAHGRRARGRMAAARPLDPATLAGGIDTSAFSFEGPVAAKGPAALDGPIQPDAPEAPSVAAAAPGPARVAAAPLSGKQARAALDVAPSAAPVDLFADSGPVQPVVMPMKTPPAHPKIYDASEGTSNDPLLEKGYDLNSAKTIPTDLVH